MDVSIDKLIEKLYDEGIKKAEKKAEEFLQETEAKAKKLIHDAEKRSQEIIQKTEDTLNQKKDTVLAELKLATQAAIAELREKIKEKLIEKAIREPIQKEILKDKDFLKKAILTILEKIEGDFKLTVPPELEEDLKTYFAAKAKNSLKNLEIEVVKGIKGFIIEEKKDGYALEFSEETLVAFFIKYLKPFTISLIKNP